MPPKSFALEFYLMFFALAALADKLQAGRLIFGWFLLGVLFGTAYSNELFSKLRQEIFIGVIGLMFLLIILDVVVGGELYVDQSVGFGDDSSTPQFLFILWQVGFSGFLVSTGAYITHSLFHRSEGDKFSLYAN